tara:strand:- start:105 stop:236 length:132 start_codon:yes stop_codon:yes gene_type:complete
MKKYFRNPKHKEVDDDVRSQERKKVFEQEHGQQDDQASKEDGE